MLLQRGRRVRRRRLHRHRCRGSGIAVRRRHRRSDCIDLDLPPDRKRRSLRVQVVTEEGGSGLGTRLVLAAERRRRLHLESGRLALMCSSLVLLSGVVRRKWARDWARTMERQKR